MNHAITGGEEIMTIAGKQGRLVVEDKSLFFNNGGTNYPISTRDIMQIRIADEWFGISSVRKSILQLDAKIYFPKGALIVA